MIAQGFVISVTNYKESSCIVNLLTKDGIVTFNAHGSQKINTKTSSICQLYNKISVDLTESAKSGFKTLKDGIVLSNFTKIYDNLEAMLTLSLIVELCKKISQSDENISNLYDLLETCFNAILNNKPLWLIRLVFISQLIIYSGLKINVDACVRCGSKKGILSLSFVDGGFVCQNCFKESESILDVTYIKLIRYIFITDFKILLDKELPMPQCYQLFIDLYKFFVNELGISSKSFILLQKASLL